MSKADKDDQPQDKRLKWLEERLKVTLQIAKVADVVKMVSNNENNRQNALDFFDNADNRRLYIWDKNEKGVPEYMIRLEPPEDARKKVLFFLKTEREKLLDEKVLPQKLLTGDMLPDTLQALDNVARHLYQPIMARNKDALKQVSEVVRPALMDSTNHLLADLLITLGLAQGKTRLPLPPIKLPKKVDEPTKDKDLLYQLESSIVSWTQQIKAAMKRNPEEMLEEAKRPGGVHPGPLKEIEFWKNKAENLRQLEDQIYDTPVLKVMVLLKKANSSYHQPFAALLQELKEASAEARDNFRFMKPLKPEFESITQFGEELDELVNQGVFRKVMHLVYMVWTHSQYYNTPARLVVLIRELCNDVIVAAKESLGSKEELFGGDVDVAIKKLSTTLSVCGHFKNCYFHYKSKAAKETSRPWRFQNTALFSRLDAFLERCHDLLDVLETATLFHRMQNVPMKIGGTAGQDLTNQAESIKAEFFSAYNAFHSVPNMDLLNVDLIGFDQHYASFRALVRDLERRMACMMVQTLDDAKSLTGLFKAVDTFEGFVDRSVINQEWLRKQLDVLKAYHADLMTVQEIFHQFKDNPQMYPNMPPSATAIVWCRGLLERITIDLGRVQELNKQLLQSELGQETMKLYESLSSVLKSYIRTTYDQWAGQVGSISSEKLKLSLIAQDDVKVYVNFDPQLIKTLREVYYLEVLNSYETQEDGTFVIPPQAVTLYRTKEVFRSQILRLDYIVSTYNTFMRELKEEEEKPLLRQELEHFQGELKKGMTDLHWNSSDQIEEFIVRALEHVNNLDHVIGTMHGNVRTIEQSMNEFIADDKFLPLNPERADAKTMNEADFKKKFDEYCKQREKTLSQKGKEIHDLIHNTMVVLNELKSKLGYPQLESDTEVWCRYIEFVNGEVRKLICASVVKSLQNLRDQLSPEWLKEKNGIPLLEIRLVLTKPKEANERPDARFEPHLASKDGSNSVDALVNELISQINTSATFVTRLDTGDPNDNYLQDVLGDRDAGRLTKEITELVAANADSCNQYMRDFLNFRDLWEKDARSEFVKFMTPKEPSAAEVAEREEEGGPPIERKFHYFGVALEEYDRSITEYEMQSENIDHLPSSRTIGFIRIDSKPLKLALKEVCEKWKKMFTGQLQSKITTDLQELMAFIGTAETGLEKDLSDGDVENLKMVMRFVRDCRVRNETMTNMFEPIQQAIHVLKQHPQSVTEEEIEALEELRKPAPDAWNQLFKKSLNTRETNAKMEQVEADKIKDQTLEFEQQISALSKQFHSITLFKRNMEVDDAYKDIDMWNQKLHEVERESLDLNDVQQLFDLTRTEFRELRESRTDLRLLKDVWDLIAFVRIMFQDWLQSIFKHVDVESFLDEIKKLQKQLRGQSVKARAWDCFKGLEEEVKNMNISLPLCAELRSDAMRPRHWEDLPNSSGNINPDTDDFTLEKLISLGLHNYAERVSGIVEKAQKEQQIERSLDKIKAIWEKKEFTYVYDNNLGTYLLGPIDEIVEQLEGDINILGAMQANRFVEFFAVEVNLWQKNLGSVDACMNKWMEIQRQWAALYPIFILSADIKEQLPDDAKNFQGADTLFRMLMNKAHNFVNVIEVITTETLKQQLGRQDELEQMLDYIQSILNQCEKALKDYLETKRRIFARFYFLSNTDLVEILSKGSEPKSVMNKIVKIIDSVDTFSIDNNPNASAGPKDVWQMISKEGEEVRLVHDYTCDGPVEDWLNGCIEIMQKSIRHHIQEANAVYLEKPRTEWIYNHPCQAIIVSSRIWFTTECQTAFQALEDGSESAMKDFLKAQRTQLDALIAEVLKERLSTQRKMLVHLITIDVHSRDIVAQMVEAKTENADAFEWQSQLRYYWDDRRGSEIRICDAEFTNCYEYIGLCGCLVITKLTDRCYITLSQALRLKKGGAPAGPAGTGKTETTKDLARNLGVACYVFNCSDQMDYLSLGQIFKGLAMSGAWGCFDEFNRIAIEVLSVVATQVGSILNALKENKQRFKFMGSDDIPIRHTVGMWITMNPGYAGRTELPENIKSLFRPCAMVVPDLKNICEIMLAAEGFIEAKDLALKFVTLYRLNQQLLSPQRHYDWGLRAVKSVLYIAGSLKRADPQISERMVLMRALRDTNLAKLSKDDVYVFLRLIDALFPKLDVPKKEKPELEEACKAVCRERKNIYGEQNIFILKCVQYEELLHVRHSVFVLGPAGCGKTQCWKTLAKAYHSLGDKCQYSVLDPKAITSNELYGYYHPMTKEWRDGILSSIFRDYEQETKKRKENSRWIVLDGIIDAEWIESMNTVMDDNKVLTLVNNDRIQLTAAMRMIFEISHLLNASPATVSRAGVVYINESDLSWMAYKEKWIKTREDDKEGTILENFFDKYVQYAFDYWKRYMKPIVAIPDICVVQTITNLLEALLANHKQLPGEVYERYFMFAMLWAFGGPLTKEGRYEFSKWWRKDPLFQPHKISDEFTIFDYYLESRDMATIRVEEEALNKGKKQEKKKKDEDEKDLQFTWRPWRVRVPDYEPEGPDVPFGSITVQTVDTIRMTFLMNLLLNRGKPCMLVGVAGTGKSNLIMSKLRQEDPQKVIFRVVAFNAKTSSAGLQNVLEQPLERRPPKSWGPPQPKKLIFFLDDINMPEPDKYGTQEAIALLRQQYDCGFWYDRSGKEGKATAKMIVDVRYVAAMNPKSGTFTILDRLLRHFGVFATIMPDRDDLNTIYGQILKDFFRGFQSEVLSVIDKVTSATISLHEIISQKFLPTAAKFFYQWNMREMMNIFQGVCKCVPSLHNKAISIVYCWMHECARTFRDRLTDEEDLRKYDGIFAEILETVKDSNTQVTIEEVGVWAPFSSSKEGDGLYDQITMDRAADHLKAKLHAYNNEKPRMELVLFEQAIEHVCRICRITGNPRGNALLVGVGGSGKQSLARLAAYINDLDALQIVVTSSYNINDFRATMQDVYKKAAIKEARIAFILTDGQIVDEGMLMYINDMLNSGIIPDLFTEDERKEQVGNIMSAAKQNSIDVGNEDAVWAFYINRVRAQVHLVLCFSPVGEQFAAWCRRFPALANTTVIDWFHPWPQQALVSVAQRFLEDVNLGSQTLIDSVSNFMARCHEDITEQADEYFRVEKRRCYTTPKSFLELIALYKTLLAQKRNDVEVAQRRLNSGIDKIKEAGDQVAALQDVLKRESVEVEEAAEKTRELMEFVSKERKKVEEQNASAQQEESRTNAIVVEVEAIAAECAKDLVAAKPLVDEALAALDTLDKTSLSELKALAKPPDDVCMVAAAVMVLTSPPNKIPPVRNRDWANAKKMMANVSQWLKDLQTFDQDHIPDQCIEQLQMYVANPSFDPASIVLKSQAASGLCKWVLGMNAYYKVRCNVKPKEERLAESQARLDTSKTALKKVQDRVADLKATLDTLVRQFDDAMEKKKEIEAKAKKTKDKAALAERLVGGLSGEKKRWGETIDMLTKKNTLLVGDVLAASAFVSYIGPFSKAFRERIVAESWMTDVVARGIPLTPGVDIVMDVLTNEASVASWENEGLPSDRISKENGALVTTCTRWPLLIDPQLQGVKWIRTREEKNGMRIVQTTQKDWLKVLKDCMESGLPILIENCSDTLEPILDNVLARATFKKPGGTKLLMKIGDAEVEYNEHFRLLLQTKLSNPIYKPEVNAQTTLINFMVTEAGLEDQLLAVVVNQERPDLELKRVALIRDMNTMTIELQKCEDGLLFELANATGDILENVTLIENLEATKAKSQQIGASMEAARITQKTIADSRLTYTSVAVRGSLLFFQIDNLCKIDHMYQYSLEAFMVVFNKALQKAEQPADPKDTKQRVENVTTSITETVYGYVSRGLFERHKLIFSSLLCFSILSRAGEIDGKQLSFLLRGPKKKGIDPPEAVSSWCPVSNWESVLALAEVDGTSPSFDTLPSDMAETARWKQWVEFEKPEDEKLPTDWKNLTEFQKLLVLRCLRPDRLTQALENFVGVKLGKYFVSDQAVDLSITYQDAGPTTPIFFILSPGVDPVGKVEAMAKKHGITYDNDKLHNVSLGQGQEKVAEDRMAKCFENGGWVMLNNIHLVKKWLLALEKRLDEYSDVYTRMAQIAKRKAEKKAARRQARLMQEGGVGDDGEGEGEEAPETEEKPEDAEAGEGAEGENPDANENGEPKEGEPSGEDNNTTNNTAADETADGEGEHADGAEEEEEEEDDEDPDLQIKGPQGNLSFRVFLAAEPSNVIPIGILQRCIKLTNEPPSGIQANVLRAMTNFSDEPWEESAKPSEYRCVMFAMCFFHAVIIERKKFGAQGWNRVYPFNVGDLTTCMSVFKNFEERTKIPWDDLRYVFGEIMYGGHITDDWDRVLCMAYLQMWIQPEVCESMDLAAGFAVPTPGTYNEYVQYVKENMPPESPMLYGLHANAEIGFRTTQADVLFKTISLLQPKTTTSEGMTPRDQVLMRVEEMMQAIPELYNIAELSERLEDDRTPQQHVFYQECERINALVEVMKRTLHELHLGINGALSMTTSMQALFQQIYDEKLPEVWASVSFLSMRPLTSWFDNMTKRNQQLTDWVPELQTPKVTMINYFFNPMSFLTAIMQFTALQNTFDLDQMALLSDVLKKSPDQIDVAARDGAYVGGLVMEGARWDAQTQSIEESRMKDLYPKVPVMNVKSLPIAKIDRKDQYECPLYKTQARGPGFVVALWLKSKHAARRWTVAGVGLLLDVVEV
eukprot:PhM_4_TR15700/c3_g1_i1/m.85000/K10408/DNAH; dynein heavy chain, axonemal